MCVCVRGKLHFTAGGEDEFGATYYISDMYKYYKKTHM